VNERGMTTVQQLRSVCSSRRSNKRTRKLNLMKVKPGLVASCAIWQECSGSVLQLHGMFRTNFSFCRSVVNYVNMYAVPLYCQLLLFVFSCFLKIIFVPLEKQCNITITSSNTLCEVIQQHNVASSFV